MQRKMTNDDYTDHTANDTKGHNGGSTWHGSSIIAQ